MRYRNTFSRLFGIFASYSFPAFLQKWVNACCVKALQIDLSEHDPIEHYPTLNALFTRSLAINRDFDTSPSALISPCDAQIITLGEVENLEALQIKGKSYSVTKLLGEAAPNGMRYCNFYLSPSDYHRFHAPTDLQILSISYFDGHLFSVKPVVLERVDSLFAQNERVVIKAMDSYGQILFFVAVGAMNVGKIVIYAEPRINTNMDKAPVTYDYQEPIFVKKGQEIGYFKMGSSIIMFYASWDTCVQEGRVRFGDCIGIRKGEETCTNKIA